MQCSVGSFQLATKQPHSCPNMQARQHQLASRLFIYRQEHTAAHKTIRQPMLTGLLLSFWGRKGDVAGGRFVACADRISQQALGGGRPQAGCCCPGLACLQPAPTASSLQSSRELGHSAQQCTADQQPMSIASSLLHPQCWYGHCWVTLSLPEAPNAALLHLNLSCSKVCL